MLSPRLVFQEERGRLGEKKREVGFEPIKSTKATRYFTTVTALPTPTLPSLMPTNVAAYINSNTNIALNTIDVRCLN